MALSQVSFDDLSERDLLDQIQAGVPEGILVDYKRDLYARGDADKREFLKDVSSFANTAGGHLIIGMDGRAQFHCDSPGASRGTSAARCSLPSEGGNELHATRGTS